MEFTINRDSESELQHHGTKGMKWGIRRYQNPDGSLTAAGKKRRSLGQTVHDYKVKRKRVKALEKARATKEANKKAAEEAEKKAEERAKKLEAGKIPAKKMTDAELAKALDRKNKEKQYKEAVLATSTGKRFVSKIWNEGVVPGMTEGGKKAVSSFMEKKLSDVLGLDKKEAKSAYQMMKEEAEMAKWRKQKFQDERDLAEARKRYKDHLEEERRRNENRESQERTANNQREQDWQYEQNQRRSNNENQRRAQERQRDRDNTINVDDPEIIGEGNSSRRNRDDRSLGSQQNSRRRPDDYYDPIDVEGEWVTEPADTPVSNLPATQRSTGRSYVTALLEDNNN